MKGSGQLKIKTVKSFFCRLLTNSKFLGEGGTGGLIFLLTID